MKDLINRLRLSASICHDRNLNLDFAAIASQAANILEQFQIAREQKPVAYRAWFDEDGGARFLFTLWPEEEQLAVDWEPLFITTGAQASCSKCIELKQVNNALAMAAIVPEGMTLAPLVAIPEMIDAAEDVEDLYKRGTPETWGKVYTAMLKAAQKIKSCTPNKTDA